MSRSKISTGSAVAATALVVSMLVIQHTKASNPDDVGAVERVLRSAYGTPPQEAKRAKNVGDDVVFKELLETYPESAAQVKFVDGSVLTLGARTSVVVDDFVFNPANAASHNYMSMSAGAMRFVTGSMPKGGTVIDTPTATLTLRGTAIRVGVTANGNTELIVDEGIVDSHSKGSNGDKNIGAGDSITITAQGFQNDDPEDTGDDVVDDGFPYNGGDTNTVEQRRQGQINSNNNASHASAPSSSPSRGGIGSFGN